jgi:hypothetical protein
VDEGHTLDVSARAVAVILAPVSGAGTEPGLRDTLRSGWRELALYLAAGVVYVAIGVTFVEFLFSWVVAAGYLLLTIVAIPALVRHIVR